MSGDFVNKTSEVGSGGTDAGAVCERVMKSCKKIEFLFRHLIGHV
jgi:hypothetical protein